jgi:hypothetical protein
VSTIGFLVSLQEIKNKNVAIVRMVFNAMAGNDHGLLLCRYLKNGQPGN